MPLEIGPENGVYAGRGVADVQLADGTDLADALIAAGPTTAEGGRHGAMNSDRYWLGCERDNLVLVHTYERGSVRRGLNGRRCDERIGPLVHQQIGEGITRAPTDRRSWAVPMLRRLKRNGLAYNRR